MFTTNIPTLYRSFNVLLEALDVYIKNFELIPGCAVHNDESKHICHIRLGETQLALPYSQMRTLSRMHHLKRSVLLRLVGGALIGLHKLAYHDHKHHNLRHGTALHSRLHQDGSFGLPRRLAQSMGLDPHNEAQLHNLAEALELLSHMTLSIPDPELPQKKSSLPKAKTHKKTRKRTKTTHKTEPKTRFIIHKLITFLDPTDDAHVLSIPAHDGRAGGTYGMVQLHPHLFALALHRFVPFPDVVVESGDMRYILSALTVLTEKHAFNRGKDEVDIELGRASRDMRTTQHARPGWARDLQYFHANMARMIEDGILQGYRIVNHIVTFFFDVTHIRETEPPDPLTSPQPNSQKRARKKIPTGFFQRLIPLPLQPG